MFHSMIAEYTNQVPVYETPKVVNSNVWSNVHNNYQFGSFLSNADVENIKSLIRHLALQVLIPHVEKQIFYLTDLVSIKFTYIFTIKQEKIIFIYLLFIFSIVL